MRPVTPVLPPKKSLRTVITRTSSRPSDSMSGVMTGAPSSPVSTPIGADRRGRNEIVAAPEPVGPHADALRNPV